MREIIALCLCCRAQREVSTLRLFILLVKQTFKEEEMAAKAATGLIN